MRQLFLTLILLFFCVEEILSQTEVSGAITSDTEWTIEGSPYLITGNTLVAKNITLTINPGVIIQASSDTYLRIDGSFRT